MQRLVYAPRAHVFTKDADGNIRDISEYVTAGSVNRRINAASSASVTLRNARTDQYPRGIFTTPNKRGMVAFTPMDPITIFLKRLPGRPVRVFTGFLDRTPYLQLYPGTITLQATCTLKRLMFTFFDAALPYTMNFLASYGWINKNGVVFSLNGLNDFKKEDDQQIKQRGLQSGSLGDLLYATMVHIGRWKPEDIYIEALPDDLFARLADLAQTFADDNEEARKEFDELMRRIVGEGSFGQGDSNVDLTGIDGSVARQVYEVGVRMNVPQRYLLAAMMVGLEESGMKNLNYSGDGKSQGWRQELTSSHPDPMNVPHSAQRFYQECKDLDKGQSTEALCYDVQRPQYYPDPSKNPYPAFRSQGASLLRHLQGQANQDATGDRGGGQPTSSDTNAPARTEQTSGAHSSTGDQVFSPIKGLDPQGGIGGGGRAYGAPRGYGGHAGVDATAPMGTSLFSIGNGTVEYAGSWGNEGMVVIIRSSQHINGYPDRARIGYGHLSELGVHAGDTVRGGQYIGKSGAGSNGEPHLHFFVTDPNSTKQNGTMDPTPLLRAAAKGEQPTGGPGAGDSADAGGGSNTDGNAAMAGAASLAATLNLPSALESFEAIALKGERSLMNDKPLLPFIQQLTDASLRQFQSLPDGKFFAFYPDYFGEMFHRKPYWEVDDIEVLDGSIYVSDEALVTHYYVVGDTMSPLGGGNELINRLSTAGIMTIYNVFMADTVLDRSNSASSLNAANQPTGPATVGKNDPRNLDKLLDRDEAIAFLDRYGARPLVEDVPMIHSMYFEMFLAYQRFLLSWSRQFLTTFTFTFMPELFPGGKVGFPDHALQCYIDEVAHYWDYTSGFMTQANLSAPSIYIPDGAEHDIAAKAANYLPSNMVRALVEPVGTAGQS